MFRLTEEATLPPAWQVFSYLNPFFYAVDGFRFAFVDTVAKYGHMLELYQPVESLTGFYEFVAKKAGKFDPSKPNGGVIVDISLG